MLQRINETIKIYNRINKEKITENKIIIFNFSIRLFIKFLDFYIGYPNFEKVKEIINKIKFFPLST